MERTSVLCYCIVVHGTRTPSLPVGRGSERMNFTRPHTTTMKTEIHEVHLDGLKLTFQKPRVIAETNHGYCWYPNLHKFSTGELMLNHSLNPDSNENLHNSQAVYISDDGGENFDFAYDVNGFHNGGGEVRISLDDGRIVGVSTFLKPAPPGQARSFAAHYWCYENGGRRYSVEPWGAKVTGLPRDVVMWNKPSRTWWASINWFSDIVVLDDGRFITTLSLRFTGDSLESTVALASDDQGRNWEYLSTIADADAIPDASEGFDEPCLIRLEDGDLMCISRVGDENKEKLARAYSSDGGQTWSQLDRLPAYSVAPDILRLQNGVLALSTGRPGVFLWLSTDARGRNWQMFDVMGFHNSVLDEQSHFDTLQTTAYTAKIENEPNRVFMIYDRKPYKGNPVTPDSGKVMQIYLLEVEVELQ